MFKFSDDLTKPTPALLLEFSGDQDSIKAAQEVARSFQQLAQAMTPFTIATIARQHFPGETLHVAVAKINIAVIQATSELSNHAWIAREVQNAERARLAPVLSTAVRRSFEIHGLLKRIDFELAGGPRDVEAKHEKYAKAGVGKADFEKMVPEFDAAPLLAEKANLLVELESLEAFTASGDERFLPEDFEVTAIPKTTFAPSFGAGIAPQRQAA